MLIGYARTSTTDQQAGFDAQLVELEAYGCERTFKEQVSAVASRGELDRAIDMQSMRSIVGATQQEQRFD